MIQGFFDLVFFLFDIEHIEHQSSVRKDQVFLGIEILLDKHVLKTTVPEF